MKSYYVYIMSSQNDKVLYIGVTYNIEKRVFEHKNEIIEGFSKKYKIKKLVYVEETSDVQSAISREKQLKKWRRSKKDFLIDQINSSRVDLSEDPSTLLGMTYRK